MTLLACAKIERQHSCAEADHPSACPLQGKTQCSFSAGSSFLRLRTIWAHQRSRLCEASHKVDTLAAQAVLRLREPYLALKLILVLPCLDQTRGWRREDVAAYDQIKASADKVVYTPLAYISGCMHERDRHLVDNSSVCVCCLTKQTGGTAYTVQYARSHGLDIIDLSK